MSRKLKMIDVDYRVNAAIIPDGYDVVTVFSSFGEDASPVNRIVLLSKEDDEQPSPASEARAGLAESQV